MDTKYIILKYLDKIIVKYNFKLPVLINNSNIYNLLNVIFHSKFKFKFKETNYLENNIILIELESNVKHKLYLNKGYSWLNIKYIFKSNNYDKILFGLLKETKITFLKKINYLVTDKLIRNIHLIFDHLNYSLESLNHQNNSINGIVYKNNTKFFYKTGYINSIQNEITGYILIKKHYPVPDLINIIFHKELIILVFNYEKSLSTDTGLLGDYITSNISNKKPVIIENIYTIFSHYSNNLNFCIYRDKYPLQKFYKKRIFERIIPWYIKNNKSKDIFSYKLVINNITYKSIIEIIENTISYFKNEKRFKCFISQGDPTDMNLCLKPLFLDFDTAGYNPIVCEFSIIFWSIYVAGGYFYPKYHQNAYKNHLNIYRKINNNCPKIKYNLNNQKININFEYNIPSIRQHILNIIVDTFIPHLNKCTPEDIKYHLILRILGTLDITTMTEYDMILSMCFVAIFNHNNLNKETIKYIMKGRFFNEKTKSQSNNIL